jgi:hypothetical protein
MSEADVEHALSRLDEHRELHLPLRRSDVLGRLAMKFLWRRQLRWQVETNLAIRDALRAIEDLRRAQAAEQPEAATQELLRHEVQSLRQGERNLAAGLNQRLYAAVGRLESQISYLQLQAADGSEQAGDVAQRLKTLEAQVATLASASTDTRLRHAQLDLFLDRVRAANAVKSARSARSVGSEEPGVEEVAESVADRAEFLELAVAELLDGPAERVRGIRRTCLPVVSAAREKGATGPVFDVAPARGEWLEVLRDTRLPYRAASPNELVRRHCAGLGLAVDDGDPLDVLGGAPARSLGTVTAFRYVERLDPVSLARFVDLSATALQPGGALVVETPAGTDGFHLDPFARRPVHPAFVRFLAEASGFTEVETQNTGTGLDAGDVHRVVAWR